METERSNNGETPWIRWCLGLLLLTCLAMRVWNGSAGLDTGRFFDERFSLRNVEMVLLEGQSRPANAFYGSLSYLPQTAVLWVSQSLHEVTGIEWLAVRSERAADGWSKTAYFLCRLVCAIFGTLNVWLTYLLGRRLFSAPVGLLGALLLTVFPRHILSSTEFKPDILVALLVALTFLWSLDAARDPSLRRLLLAGSGVGLAVAAKYTGVGVAIPLTVGVLYYGWRDRKVWKSLILAGVMSIVTFALLNIHLAVIIEYLPRIWSIMESKGDATGGSRWDVLWLELRYLILHHRPLVMVFVVAGIGGLFRRAFAKGTERFQRLEAVMILSYVFGYSFLYAAATKLFKGQNYLPVAVFTSLAGAWAMVETWKWLTARAPALARGPLATLVWALVTVGVFVHPTWVIYEDVVPTTQRLLEKHIMRTLRPLELRHVFYEKRDETLKASTPAGHWLVTLPSDQVIDFGTERLDLSDAEVFYADRLESGESQPEHLRRSVRDGVRVARFDAAPFRAHGPSLVALIHPWTLVDDSGDLPIETLGDNRFTAEVPAIADGAAVDGAKATTASLAMWLPLHTGKVKPKSVVVNGHELPLYRTRRGGRRAHFITPRVPLPEQLDRLTLGFDPEVRLDWAPEVRLIRWAAP